MQIMFDVGANYGTDSLPIIHDNSDWICFAFEPTPHLIDYLKKSSSSFSDRYHIIPYAVSDFNGEANFHISGQSDWGCSSLLTFSDNLHETWPGRTDFKVTETIKVKVITLKQFIEQMSPVPITTIHRFHCDTQGSDLKVLKGMEEYINIILNGVVEAANKKNILYNNQNTVEETNAYLQQYNFITNIEINDQFHNEVNIRFNK